MKFLSKLSEIFLKIKIERIIALVLLVLPLNVYIIGDFIGCGIQISFFRFQTTDMGNSSIFITQDLNYIISGVINGRSALSEFLWIIGLCFLLSAILLLFIKLNGFEKMKRYSGVSIVLAGILFLISIAIQYGLTFHGPAGIAIPVGLPILFIIGGWIYRI